MEKKLTYHQNKVEENTTYLINILGKQKLTLISILIPSFMMGWTAASTTRGKSRIKQLIKFGILATLAHVRKILL